MSPEFYILLIIWALGGDLVINVIKDLNSGQMWLFEDRCGKAALFVVFLLWPLFALFILLSRRRN